jgi:outer membrane protein assembly factor BamB
MSPSLRRALIALLAVAVAAAASLGPATYAQKAVEKKAPLPTPVPAGPVPAPPTGNAPQLDEASHAISLPTDNRLKQQIEAAVDNIKAENWVLATEVLQKLVSIKEDVFVKVPRRLPDGREDHALVSVRAEADRLIGTLPRKGMEFYRLNYGPKAADLLKQARESGKPELLAQVMRLYMHTEAGAEATELLGTYLLDRGNYGLAALCFERLLNREGPDKLAPLTLYKAAYAFHQTGAGADKANEELVWRELNKRARELRVGAQTRTVPELQSYVDHLVRAYADRYVSDYPIYGGNESRTAQTFGDYAFMEPRWRQPMLRAGEGGQAVGAWLKRAEEQLKARNLPLLPAFYPVTATLTRDDKQTGKPEKVPLLVYRSHWGLHAVNMRDGKVEWETPSDWSPCVMAAAQRKNAALTHWMQIYLDQTPRPGVLFENSVTGSLSTDSHFAYAVEDLVVPPPPFQPEFNGGFANHPGLGRYGPEVSEAVQHSRLLAFDLRTGKLAWQLGERGQGGPLEDCYFLGPPLPLGGKLYVLTERQQELRLVCVNPTAAQKQVGERTFWQPRVESAQTLATTRDKIQNDVARRAQAAHLAYGEGILVCPTNAGAVLGVDLLSNSLLWAYPYREKGDGPDEPTGPPMPGRFPGRVIIGPNGMPMGTAQVPQQWKVTAPVIAEGKVVFAAPDARSVHCVSLRDGTRAWARPHPRQEGDQYLAGVFAGRVLLVGKKTVRALSLATGEPLWTLETGQPSGQGVASGNVYYLPVREAPQDKEPEIVAIDVEKGKVLAHTKSRAAQDRAEVPGNLLFYEGDVISQNLAEVVAFPQLKAKLAEIDGLIAKNPNDPDGLTERGVLRLDKGDLHDAVEDFRKALANGPAAKTRARARAKLYETFTELFQRDFNKAEERGYLKEYEGLCAAAEGEAGAEERRRRANFLCLVAKGREAQGRLDEAFEKYQEFAAAAGTDLISVVDEPRVKAAPDVWARGRIEAMLAAARPEQRRPLEERLRRRWEEVRQGSTEDLKKFVALFGGGFAVGRDATLALAERLADDPDPHALLEAERLLEGLRAGRDDPQSAARACEALARICLRKAAAAGDNRLLEDAAYYYRLLGGPEFAAVVVRDGKTGADLYVEGLETDKRLLNYLDGEARLLAPGKIRVTEERGAFPPAGQAYGFEQEGERLPFFRHSRLALRLDYHQLKLTDRADNKERWSKNLTRTMFQNVVFGNNRPDAPPFRYQTLGHLIVLPLGNMVFGIDPLAPDDKRVLWEKSLLAAQAGPNPPHLAVDPGDGTIQAVYQDGYKRRLGQTGPLNGALCLQTDDGLLALDPVTGRTLWSREGVRSDSHVFGDGDTVYVVEMSGDVPAATRALRARDGVSVPAPDFAPLYKDRVRVRGRQLLLQEAGPGGGVVLRLYDVRDGKDVWRHAFAPGAAVLRSEDPDLAGVAEPDGAVHVFDLRTLKEVLRAKLDDPKDLDKVQSVQLLSDGRQFYVACNGPVDPAVLPLGGVQTNLMPATGLRAVPVNGAVYAFRPDGKRVWRNKVANQMVVLERFDDLPVMLFTARYQRWMRGAVRNIEVVAPVLSIDKRTGKLLYNNENIPSGVNFHALNVDAARGRIEFVNYQMKIVHVLNGDGGARAEGPAPGAAAEEAPAPGPVRGLRSRVIRVPDPPPR